MRAYLARDLRLECLGIQSPLLLLPPLQPLKLQALLICFQALLLLCPRIAELLLLWGELGERDWLGRPRGTAGVRK